MLEVRGLSKTYRSGTAALADVTFEMGEGVLGLLGPNGAGKTTLLSILATVTRPTAGTFLWQGRDAVRDPFAVRRVLGFLPQDFGVYERLTAREFLVYLGRLKGLSGGALKRRVDDLLTLVNLHGAADRRLGGFSGGMRQRVGITQALLGDPKLVVVDEPTVGLDPEERVRFRNLLAEIAHGRVVILSTHIVSDLEAVASKIAMLSAADSAGSRRPRTPRARRRPGLHGRRARRVRFLRPEAVPVSGMVGGRTAFTCDVGAARGHAAGRPRGRVPPLDARRRARA